MARVRRHQRRRAAGVLHSLRDLRVRRALNSWLGMACKCSPRRHPPPLSHRCGARSTRGSRWRALARHRSAPSRAPSSACATIASCVRSTRGSKRPLIGGRRSGVCARPSTSCAAAACAPAGTGGACASTLAVAIAVSSRAYATEVRLRLIASDCV
jgi:hypothetical protein